MAPKKSSLTVETITHAADSRKNIPTAEYQSVVEADQRGPKTVRYPRNTDLDPQLVWRGKDEQDWSDLVVHAPPLFIQEKVHPKVLIDDLLRQSQNRKPQATDSQADLFAVFDGTPTNADKTEFYQHDQNWSNRMILGDSLQVMASLAEREGLRGKVQCIYLDPPYGIKFNSNFQWSTTSRDVSDGDIGHITREPEQVKAFRDTWRDGVNTYLSYLRDRLTVARDLLSDSGAIFVQIGEENVHRVRALMDEIFGESNFCSLIVFQKTSGETTTTVPTTHDFIVFYAKNIKFLKYRKLYKPTSAGEAGAKEYKRVETEDGNIFPISKFTENGRVTIPIGARILTTDSIVSKGGNSPDIDVWSMGRKFVLSCKPNRHWKTSESGIKRLWKIGRLLHQSGLRIYKRYFNDFCYQEMSHVWSDTRGEDDASYVVQTHTKVVERCVLMVTDTGDLVLDPTCGSGTAA